MDVELTVGFLSFKESYVSKVTLKPYESVEVRLYATRMPTVGLTLRPSGRCSIVNPAVQHFGYRVAVPACTCFALIMPFYWSGFCGDIHCWVRKPDSCHPRSFIRFCEPSPRGCVRERLRPGVEDDGQGL